MPNNCENTLHVFGKPKDVEKAFSYMGTPEYPLNFNRIIPYPKEFAERDKEFRELGWAGVEAKYGKGAKDGYNSGGYEWSVNNWGTKWNAYDVVRKDNTITFETAWSPPLPIISKIHADNPNVMLRFEYKEPGVEFGGCQTFNSLKYKEYRDPGTKDQTPVPGVPDKDLYWEGEEFHKQYPEYRIQLALEEAEEPVTLEAEMANKKLEAAETPAKQWLTSGTPGYDEAVEKFAADHHDELIAAVEKVTESEKDIDKGDENALLTVMGLFNPLIEKAKEYNLVLDVDDVADLFSAAMAKTGVPLLEAPKETRALFLEEAEKNHKKSWWLLMANTLAVMAVTGHDYRKHMFYMGSLLDATYAANLLKTVRVAKWVESPYDLVRETIMEKIAKVDLLSRVPHNYTSTTKPILTAIRHNLIPAEWHQYAGVVAFNHFVRKGRDVGVTVDDRVHTFMDPLTGSMHTIELKSVLSLVSDFLNGIHQLPGAMNRDDVQAVVHQLMAMRTIPTEMASSVFYVAAELVRGALRDTIMSEVIKLVEASLKE